MAITFIEAQQLVNAQAGPYTSPAFTNAIAAGDCIVVAIASYTSGGGVPASSISDNASNTWPASPYVTDVGTFGSGTNKNIDFWFLPNANAKSAGTYTVTVNRTDSPIVVNFGVGVFRGVKSTSPGEQSGSAASNTAVSALSPTTAGAITDGGDLLIASCMPGTGAANAGCALPTNYGTWNNLFVNQNDSSSVAGLGAYLILSGASLATKTADWTWSGGANNDCVAVIAALLPGATTAQNQLAWIRA